MSFPIFIVEKRPRRPYGFGRFCLDVFLFFATAGFWLFWIIFREIKNG